MRGRRCPHTPDERGPGRDCRQCRKFLRQYSEDTRPAGDHPTRALALALDDGAVEAGPAHARVRRALGGGTYHTRVGGGTGRAWVACDCRLCAHLKPQRLLDGDRDAARVHYWARIPNAPAHWRNPCE